MTSNETRGAKPSYTAAQLGEAVDALVLKQVEPSAKAVTEYFKDHFGLQKTPRSEPLQKKIEAYLRDRSERADAKLLRNLPPHLVDQVRKSFEVQERQALLIVAAAHARTQKDASSEISKYQEQIGELTERALELREKVHDAQEALACSGDDLAAAKLLVEELRERVREQDIQIRELKATVAANREAMQVLKELTSIPDARAA